jgi:dihydroceramide fatty acyl 2-hydroxylase
MSTSSAKRHAFREFENPVLERLTQSDPRVSGLFWVSIGAIFLFEARSLMAFHPIEAFLTVLATLVIWTLLEYWVHRSLFHFQPKTETGRKFLYLLHEHHHVHPDQPHRNMLPLTVTIPIGALLWTLTISLLPYEFSCLVVGVIALGYISYDTVHYFTHRKGPWLPFNLRRHHMLHHYHSEKVNFGILTGFWDRVFGTYKQ